MKKYYFLVVAFIVTNICLAQTIFINEIHYSNTGGDLNEGVEIAGPAGTNLAGFQVRLYNSLGSLYSKILYLSGTIPNQQNNMGTLWFPKSGIQNGPADGIALVDNLGNVIQFLSYGGTTTATEGPADGMTSIDIGVEEDESTPSNYSLQLIGGGTNYTDFTWIGPIENTVGSPNTNQTLPVLKNEIKGFSIYPNPVISGHKLYITSSNNLQLTIEIYSQLGQLVFKGNNNYSATKSLKIPALKEGIYLLRAVEENKISVKKLVIQ